jgi:prepilin-type N-terminal cleavage/methylation domain-containing protein
MMPKVFTKAKKFRPASFTARSAAFTLVELMVSLVILSILMSLALGGIMGARARARIAKTESTIRKISEIILPYYETYETRRPLLPGNAATLTDRKALAELRRIALRRLMTMELPERTSDIKSMFDPATFALPGQSSVPAPFAANYAGTTYPLTEMAPIANRYRAIMIDVPPDTVAARLDSIQSSDLLHMIVTRGVVADPEVTAHFRADEQADTNGNGMPEFVDGWGKPIMFKRWPIGFNSPLQPIDGSLASRDERVSLNGHRLVPLIYSGGQDQVIDINDVNETGVTGEFSYANFAFDPFAVAMSTTWQEPPTGAFGEVFLVPIVNGAITTFSSQRVNGAVPAGGFQTIASERAIEGGTLGSRDNIHNHNMTR